MFCHGMSRTRQSPDDEPHFLVRTLRSAANDGERIPPHSHPWPQLIVPVRGVLTVWTTVGSWVVPPGSALWAPAEIPHAIRCAGRVEMHSLYFRPYDVPGRLPQTTGVIAVAPLLRELIARSVQIGMLDERVPTHHAIALLITAALTERETPAFELPMPYSPRLLSVVSSSSLTSQTPASLARAAGMSLRTLERHFRSETGMSIGRWLRQSRMIDGLLALASGGSVASVALRAGYSTPSAFVAAFRDLFGTTPGQFFHEGSAEPQV